jgi:hypothetical protein
MASGPLLIKHDTGLAQAVSIDFIPGGKPKFQFPPVCVADSKAGHYLEADVIAADTLKIALGSEARNLSIEATYIIDGDKDGGWNAAKIYEEIRTLKANLYLGEQGKARLAKIDFYHISEANGTYAYMSFDIKYEGPIMGSGRDAWPMVTKATMAFKSWVKMVDKQNINEILPIVTKEWY